MSLILKQETTASIPTPPAGKATLFLNDSDQLTIKNSSGNVASSLTFTSAGNTSVFFNDAGALGQDANLTFNKTTKLMTVANLTVTGTLIAGDIAVSSIANGTSNVDIVGVSGNITTSVGGVANVLVVTSTGANIAGTLNATGNANVGNLGTAGLIVATGNVSGGNITTAGRLVSSIATGTAPLTVTSTTRVSNLNVDYANVADNINVTAPGTGTGYIVFANATTGNVAEWATAGITSNLANNSITATTFVGALSGAATSATTAGTVTTAAQGNITSLGTLTGLSVTGNANVGNLGTGGLIVATGNVTGGNLTTGGVLSVTGNANVGNLGTAGLIVATGNVTGGNLVTGGALSVTGNANISGILLIGTNATQADFPNAKVIVSQANSGQTHAENIGIVGEAVADSGNTSTWGIGLLGEARANGATKATGVQGGAYVTNTADSGAAVGVRGYATQTHAGGYNIGVLGNAAGSGLGNYAFYVQSGNIASIETNNLVWDLADNSNSALIFNSTGKANIFGIETTDGAEGIYTQGYLNVTGNASVGGLKTNNLYYANGSPWDLQEAAGANTQIQFNNGVNNNFGASANFTFNNTTNVLTVTGNVSATVITGTTLGGSLTTNAQPNITSVGTLTSLAVTGNASAGNVNATSAVVASTLTSNIATGTQPLTVTSTTRVANLNVAYANVADFINVTAPGTGTGYLIFANATTGNIAEWTSAGISSNLANNSITATTFVGALSGAATSATTAGTVTTAAQPNITSVGTLTSLGVSGTVTAPAFTANTGVFTGNGSSLSAIAGANVTGTVANATFATSAGSATTAGTVTTAAQPNITSVGTLTSLGVSGNATAGNLGVSGTITSVNITANTGVFTGNGSGLSAIAGANVTGTVANATFATSAGTAGTVTTAAQPNITSVGTLTSLSVTGNVAGGNLTTVGVLSVTGTGVSSIAGNLDMTSNTIINLATPTNSTDAATKQYVDDVAQGLNIHDSCNAATTTTLATISGGTVTYNNGTAGVGATLTTTGTYTTIDGVTLADGMRILVKNEVTTANNGIYVRTSATVLTRAADFNTPTEMEGGDFTFVTAGTLYDNTGWVMTDPVTTVGTSPVTWVQFSGAGTYSAGTGLTLTGTTFSVNAAQSQITSVGTLTSLAVTGNISAGNVSATTFTGALSGAATSATTAGTVTTNAQPNITSTGTLTSLAVTGNISAGNVSATTFTGALSGAATSATTAGTVTTNAQPNITSVGTLTSLAVTATTTSGNFATAGNITASFLVSNIATGTAPLTVTSTTLVPNLYVARANVADNINVVAGTGNNYLIFANAATGNISELTSTGLTANLSNNSITATTFVGALSGAATSATTAGTVTTNAQPNITSTGTLTSLGVSGTVTAPAFTANTGVFTGNGSGLSAIAGANVTGTVANATFATSAGSATTAGTVTTAAQPNITSVSTSFTSLTFANAQTISGNNMTLTTGANTNAGTITGNWILSAGSRWNATYADLSEKYVADANYGPGTVLVFGGVHEVTLSTKMDTTRVAGVVTTDAAYTMNSGLEAEFVADIALQGRVPVKVIGPVFKGDLLVAASNGHAIANNEARAGTIIGKSLENFNEDSGVVEVAVGRF
jgi:hypothetical protein